MDLLMICMDTKGLSESRRKDRSIEQQAKEEKEQKTQWEYA
jgi:predicted GTPase